MTGSVYAKPAFGGPDAGVALSRPLHPSCGHFQSSTCWPSTRERVTFRWKDYAHGGKQGTDDTCLPAEFLRRFFLHVLPRGFVRIRHFGFLANRFRASRLALSRQRLSRDSPPPDQAVTGQASSEASSLWHCPLCGATMLVVQRFTAAELSTCTYFDSS